MPAPGAPAWDPTTGSSLLGRPIACAGDDTAPFEKQAAQAMGATIAFDTALIFRGLQRDGMVPAPDSADAPSAMLGGPLRTYRAFAEEPAGRGG